MKLIISHTIEGKRNDLANQLDYLRTTVEFLFREKRSPNRLARFCKEIVKKRTTELL